MRFRIQTDIFRKAIETAAHAAGSNNLTPILENILIDAGYKKVILTGNNLEMAIEYIIEEGVDVEVEGKFTISSKVLLQKSFQLSPISLQKILSKLPQKTLKMLSKKLFFRRQMELYAQYLQASISKLHQNGLYLLLPTASVSRSSLLVMAWSDTSLLLLFQRKLLQN